MLAMFPLGGALVCSSLSSGVLPRGEDHFFAAVVPAAIIPSAFAVADAGLPTSPNKLFSFGIGCTLRC